MALSEKAIKANTDNYFSGSSGLVLPFKNKAAYPPAYQIGSRLEYYASLFNSIEVNSSFYKIPQLKTIEKWAALVPDEFRFTFKLWKEITHSKALLFKADDVVQFMETIKGVGNHKGCLLIQFPPGLTARMDHRLEDLLRLVRLTDTENPWQVALEFRHASWYQEQIFDLAKDLRASIVIHDKTHAPFSRLDQPGNVVYLRFHGPGGNYRGSYSDSFLEEYADYIYNWRLEGKAVYAYFNNTLGSAILNLQKLNEFVQNIA